MKHLHGKKSIWLAASLTLLALHFPLSVAMPADKLVGLYSARVMSQRAVAQITNFPCTEGNSSL